MAHFEGHRTSCAGQRGAGMSNEILTVEAEGIKERVCSPMKGTEGMRP